MRKQLSVIIALIAFLIMSYIQVTDYWKRMQVWRKGSIESAVITKISPSYSKRSVIYVQAGGRTFRLPDKKEDYTVSAFKAGNSIAIRIHPDYDIVLRANNNPTSRIFLVVFFMFLSGWIAWYVIRKSFQTPQK
ncbi:hypothetical protein [Chitinophaga deserti]|uniref:hypothetical protein n=1 Tax=Chitinophaga deserti TaxID=2164099 RepID=UPI000D6C4A0C|nr:hypothetical protein [Chitinophaga deserti]